jgi:hypothetical protein
MACIVQLQASTPTTMQHAATSGPLGSAINPCTAYIGCGMDSSPDTMVTCTAASNASTLLSLACLRCRMYADLWYCRVCTVGQQLAVGQRITTEPSQNLHPGGTTAQPHYTQVLRSQLQGTPARSVPGHGMHHSQPGAGTAVLH